MVRSAGRVVARAKVTRLRLLGMVSLLAICGTPAMADSNCALKQVASVPADFKHGGIIIDVGVGDQTVKFVLGTGMTFTEINGVAAQRLGLALSGRRIRMNSAIGTTERDVFIVPDFRLGQMVSHANNFVATDHYGDGADNGVVGLLGQDFLFNYDVELDPSQGLVNFFLPIECAGHAAYWSDEHFEIPLSVSQYKELATELTLDGKSFRAYLDTGSSKSSIDITEARRQLDVPADIEAPEPAKPGTVGPRPPNPTYMFKELVFGPITLRNPKLELRRYRALATHGSHIQETYSEEAPVSIGMDILGKFHSMISYRNDIMYFTLPNERNPDPPKP